MEYQGLIAVVERGEGPKLVRCINASGSRTGTLLRGRGAGQHEKQTLLNASLEPEKDILLLVAPVEETEAIITRVDEELNIKEPGKGILIGIGLKRVHGL